MVELVGKKVVISRGREMREGMTGNRQETLAAQILAKHDVSEDPKQMKIKFDALASHDITYVGIIQTARASGLKTFPLPYVLTNCHNSLCAVGGTINEDDHRFGLSAAEKYGGIYVPAHQAVIHQYNREQLAGCGKMILGSDSHTRYGALGTMGVGEGGPELVKQLLERTWDVAPPEVIAVYLEGSPRPGVGPMDVALALVGKVFPSGFVKNKIMEFVGPGVAGLSVDYRNGIDVMTTETTCLSSIWTTDNKVRDYYALHGREEEYRELIPGERAEYDGLIKIDLSRVEPMIALPFHPSNVYPLREVIADPKPFLAAVEQYDGSLDLQSKVIEGKLHVDQGSIVGCSGGTYENLMAAASLLKGKYIGPGGFTLSAYPSSQPVYAGLIRDGAIGELMKAGAIVRSAFCGPCFGAGDTPRHNGLSIRHATRNFPNRDGSKPGEGQTACVALMDARSIAATAANGGILTSALEVMTAEPVNTYEYDGEIYVHRCYNGWGKARPEEELIYGPNIRDWPDMITLPDDLLLTVASYITDPVTTTDELIPSGETSSYRSNPLRLAEFALGRKDPAYVDRAKAIQVLEKLREKWLAGETTAEEEKTLFDGLSEIYPRVQDKPAFLRKTALGSLIYAVKPGDGSAREQAASVQKVLGGWANIARDYATKRYRSNLINWGMLPFIVDEIDSSKFAVNSVILIEGIGEAVKRGDESVKARVLGGEEITLGLPNFTGGERKIVSKGCLMNFYGNEE